jgi:hypothetical protein
MDRQVTSNPRIEMQTPQTEAELNAGILRRTSYDGVPIGKGTTTLDWLRELTDEQRVTIANLREENRRLRQKNRNQRAELRRLNDAHLRKNARIVNVEGELCALLGSIERSIRAGNLIIR